MRKVMLIFFLVVASVGFGGWLSGGSDDDPRLKTERDVENKAIVRLEERILQLEKRLATLEQRNDIHNDDEWKSRALGSKVVNGSRVYVLPLSRSADRD